MTDEQKVKNIIAFLAILFGESKVWHDEIMQFTPAYIIEKFNRYVQGCVYSADWGLHPSLRRFVFEPYCKKWGIDYEQYKDIG